MLKIAQTILWSIQKSNRSIYICKHAGHAQPSKTFKEFTEIYRNIIYIH